MLLLDYKGIKFWVFISLAGVRGKGNVCVVDFQTQLYEKNEHLNNAAIL
jgi:hypothetical protein